MTAALSAGAMKAHTHKFDIPAKTVVLPHKRSRMSFKDVLKQWKCACGEVTTYDLERQEV